MFVEFTIKNMLFLALMVFSVSIHATHFDNERPQFITQWVQWVLEQLAVGTSSNEIFTQLVLQSSEFRQQMARRDGSLVADSFGRPRRPQSITSTPVTDYAVTLSLFARRYRSFKISVYRTS
jgi:hypothetical protein